MSARSADSCDHRSRCRRRRGRANAGHRRRSTSRAVTSWPFVERDRDAGLARFDRRDLVLDPRQRRERRGARLSSAARRCRFSMLWPNASSPISEAAKLTSGARIEPRGRVDDPHDPEWRGVRGASAPRRRALRARSPSPPAARWCDDRRPARRAISAVSTPASASAIAAVSPAGPPPTICHFDG